MHNRSGMKTLVEPVGAAVVLERRGFAVWSELIKARLTLLVVLTAGVGYYMGQDVGSDWSGLFHLVLGIGLLASGAAALNQWLEREHDARMRRTEDRPLPSGRLRSETALWVGWLSALVGVLYLAIGVSRLVAVLGVVTLVIYLFVYTPLKRVTWWNTIVGAVPGALPPLMGWAAARGSLDGGGWLLFGVLALWQIPHFLAIAWIYREDYGRAGFAMLPFYDPSGRRTARYALVCAVLLAVWSLLPVGLGMAGWTYLTAAVVLGGMFAGLAWRFWMEVTEPRARGLFYGSLLYLPAVLAVLALDKS